MDQGWLKANGPSEFDDEDPYVSDDDGGPSEVRISPAMFRALASGCTLDDVDSLRRVLPETPTMRPVTPHDKIMDVSKDTIRCNNVMPYCHRRQFDIHTGEELSPAYRIDQGPPSSVLWSPPGVTPERAGLYLLLLQEGQGEQQHPVRGSGMASLFQRMAPLDCNKLRTHLYGGLQGDEEEQSGNSSLSSTSFSSSSWVSSASLDSVANDKNDGHEERRRTMTFTWSEVNEAVRNCHFDAATTSLKEVNIGTRSLTRIGTETLRVRANAVATERALLQTFRNSWHTIQSGQVADASLVAANEEAQAAITAQARCLSVVEHQVELCRKAELARECQEAQEHYREQCRIEKQEKRRAARESRQARNQVRRRRRIVRNINESLRSLRTTVGESEARLARGRELQTVLIQRLKDGEARLERLCQDHGVSDVAALSEVLAARMAQLGVEEEE
ncbi:hypothetical protein SBRCBS47491_003049 [Sporothrix bragantina]|uniref:Uncharacterized protein n=1 Tax=Sporothrix bragantina TaxID=671064 RepID=A0ABP0BBV8_9PEZI